MMTPKPPARPACRVALGFLGPILMGATMLCGTAAAQGETQAAQAELRFQQLEDQIRTLTGENETQAHRIDLLTQQLEKLRGDTELRLNDLEAKTGGTAGSAAMGSAPPGNPNDGGVSTPPPPGPAAAPGAPPRSLGSIPAGEIPPSPPPGPPAQPTPKSVYHEAYVLIGEGRYADAEKGFRKFLAEYPHDAMASGAAYWVGQSYYARHDFQSAAVALADAYKKYPSGTKAPDTLLDLGKSLAKLGRVPDACATFTQLGKQFGKTLAPTIKHEAQQEKSRLRCG